MSFITLPISVQDIATAAFNAPGFLEYAGDDCLAEAVEIFISEAADKWEMHSGTAPLQSSVIAATILLTGMATAALVSREEEAAALKEAEDRICYRGETWRGPGYAR